MKDLQLSNTYGPKKCCSCGKKFIGWGYVKGYNQNAEHLIDFELTVCNSCYKKQRY